MNKVMCVFDHSYIIINTDANLEPATIYSNNDESLEFQLIDDTNTVDYILSDKEYEDVCDYIDSQMKFFDTVDELHVEYDKQVRLLLNDIKLIHQDDYSIRVRSD